MAFGIFYLLLDSLSFEFSKIDSTWSAVIVILFLLIIGAVTFYALHRWAPKNTAKKEAPINSQQKVQGITISTQEIYTCSQCKFGYKIDNPLGKNAGIMGATITCPKCGHIEKVKNGILDF